MNSRARRPLLFVAALAGALLLCSALIPSATPGSRGDSARSALVVAASSGVLPAALQTPWVARAGYNASQAAATAPRGPVEGSVEVTLTFWPTNLDLFNRSPQAALSVPALADEFGLSPAAYSGIEGYFAHEGIRVLHAWPDRMSLTLDGSAQNISRAFGTTLELGLLGNRSVYYPLTPPALPAPYSREVAAISGLSSGLSEFTIPFGALPSPAIALRPAALRTSSVIYPSALHTAYDFDGLYNFSASRPYATGTGIALLLWGDGYSPSDIRTFFQDYYPAGFPSVNVSAYPVDGAPAPSAGATSDPSAAPEELTLDLEWAGSEAPGANLYAVYAPDGPASNNYSPTDPTMETALTTAIDDISGLDVISMSFGSLDGSDPSFQAAYSVDFATAEARGITVVAASGDTGGLLQPGCKGSLDPQFPSASPLVLAVGGTAPVLALDPLGGVTGLASEPAWSDSGGGFSRSYPAPAWQEVGSAMAPILADGHRGIPDVAGPAADNFLYYNGAQAAGKGTSFAAPVWAGLIATLDHVRGTPLGFVTPRLYAIGAGEAVGTSPQGMVEITSGANCVASTGTGWSAVDGWGSPRGLTLYEALEYSFVDLRLSAPSGTLTPGASTSVRVQVLNVTSHQPIPNLPVAFTLSSVESVGLCLGTLSTASGTTDANGEVFANLSVPTCYFGTQASLSATVTGAGFYGSNSTTLTVNLLGLEGSLYIVEEYPYNLVVFVLILAAAITIGWALGRGRRAGPPPRGPPPGAMVRAPPAAAPPTGGAPPPGTGPRN